MVLGKDFLKLSHRLGILINAIPQRDCVTPLWGIELISSTDNRLVSLSPSLGSAEGQELQAPRDGGSGESMARGVRRYSCSYPDGPVGQGSSRPSLAST